MLPNDAIHEFQEIYRKTYKKELSFEEAKIMSMKLLSLYKILLNDQLNTPIIKVFLKGGE
ncbi:hypothetical protein HY029_02845 [Candidatus Gottesmanbacteria bacterium]|nr:hypothetical protein [Candidatus Gottesmanbacteria bacterium]